MSIIEETANLVYRYAVSVCAPDEKVLVKDALVEICGADARIREEQKKQPQEYSAVQEVLSKINERESIRKVKGVYYTLADVVRFIVTNTFQLSAGQLTADTISSGGLADCDGSIFSKRKLVFDPTCGAGEFLLSALELKFDLWERETAQTTQEDVEAVVKTIYGNDINEESIIISQLRIYLCAMHRYGVQRCVGVPGILKSNFYTDDFVVSPPDNGEKYDLIVGNPPYVEDKKSGLDLGDRYGNIYANVLVNAAKRLKKNGAFGFIIPLSYVATPRMGKLRNELYKLVPEQYILSYSDRPDCLFASVHQKLSILMCRNTDSDRCIFTGNYQYWYKEERSGLFDGTSILSNTFVEDGFIPKIGNPFDSGVYQKVIREDDRVPFSDLPKPGDGKIYLNMRAAFWIKAFLSEHTGAEYRKYSFESEEVGCYVMCLLNSSLFWWYWVCVSDCWHITGKELKRFMVPVTREYAELVRLARKLEERLEKTKVFVGTKQVEYEYKHRDCVDEIHQIDDHINHLYGLTEEESNYIKEFAYRYRISGGAET